MATKKEEEISTKEFIRRHRISMKKLLNKMAKEKGYSDYNCWKAMELDD